MNTEEELNNAFDDLRKRTFLQKIFSLTDMKRSVNGYIIL